MGGHALGELLEVGDHADETVLHAQGVQGFGGAVERLRVEGAKALVEEDRLEGEAAAGSEARTSPGETGERTGNDPMRVQ